MGERVWLHQLGVAVDQVVNAFFGGYADETISARSYRLGSKAKARGVWDRWRVVWAVADALFIYQDMMIQYRTGVAPDKGHCQRAYEAEKARMGMPPEYRI